jgi:hypothetical protein
MRKPQTLVQVVTLDLHFAWHTETTEPYTEVKQVFNNAKSDNFFKNPYATMYSGVTPQAYNDLASAVNSDIKSTACNDMIASLIFFMHVQFHYVKHSNILQFQQEYFRIFTVTSPFLLFLDLCKHALSKAEMTIHRKYSEYLNPFSASQWQCFYVVYAILFLKGIVVASLGIDTNGLYY